MSDISYKSSALQMIYMKSHVQTHVHTYGMLSAVIVTLRFKLGSQTMEIYTCIYSQTCGKAKNWLHKTGASLIKVDFHFFAFHEIVAFKDCLIQVAFKTGLTLCRRVH